MSTAMKLLQSKCGAVADGAFGRNTAKAICKHYDLSAKRGAHILGQASHESGGFKRTKESLYYSTPERIQSVWPSRFATVDDAKPFAKNPEALAAKVYKRKSLGNLSEQDAIDFIGRGFIQLTGKGGYRSFASDMRIPEIMENPSLVETEYAFESALWFFLKNNLMALADQGVDDDTIKTISRKINGGYHGLAHRQEETKKIYGWLTE